VTVGAVAEAGLEQAGCFLVGIVIIGGIRRIAQVADKVVPFMAVIYVAAALFILFDNAANIPWAFGEIFRRAFTPEAGLGGFIGVLVTGFRRAAFSNEAGSGSAAIACRLEGAGPRGPPAIAHPRRRPL
jgi:Na+/alanine symporter